MWFNLFCFIWSIYYLFQNNWTVDNCFRIILFGNGLSILSDMLIFLYRSSDLLGVESEGILEEASRRPETESLLNVELATEPLISPSSSRLLKFVPFIIIISDMATTLGGGLLKLYSSLVYQRSWIIT